MTPWEEKPITFIALAKENKVIDIPTGDKIGVIIHSTRKYNRRISLMMRHIRVDGSNGAAYYGRYAEAKGQVVCLKRCADMRTTEAKANSKRRAAKRKRNVVGANGWSPEESLKIG